MSKTRTIIHAEELEKHQVRPMRFEEVPDSGAVPLVIPFDEESNTKTGPTPEALQRLKKKAQANANRPGGPQAPEGDIEPPPAPAQPGLTPEQMEELYARLRRNDDEIEQRIQQAYERGVADGERRTDDLEAQLAERYAYGLEKLSMLGSGLETLARHEALEIALMVARRIIQVEIEMRPMVLVEQVKRVARELMGKQELTIHLHPSDLALIRNIAPDFASVFPAVAQINVIGDEDLERGDCVIDTEVEQINMTLAEQLSAIKRALDEEVV